MVWEKIVDQRTNQGYAGHAEKCTYTFSLWPEQIPGGSWVAQQFVNDHIKELAKEGSDLLELRVWEDVSPTWTTNYYVEIVATASPLWWNLIIAGALLLFLGIAIAFIIKDVEDIVEYIGEKAPIAIPLLAIVGIGLLAVIGIALVKGKGGT